MPSTPVSGEGRMHVNVPVRDWLLMPGWGFSAQIMMPIRDRLFDALSAMPGAAPRVCVVDVPPDDRAHARATIDDSTAPPPPPLSLSMARSRLPAHGSPDRARARWVECLRREAGERFERAAGSIAPARPIGLCAWSLGATLALDWAARHPVEIGALVLLGATPRFVAGDGWPCAMPLDEFRAFAGLAESAPRAAQARLAALSAALFLGEPLPWNVLAGLALVSAGIVFGVRKVAARPTLAPALKGAQ
jgi:pimeloyl-ACP methyl ester carboxylesterase